MAYFDAAMVPYYRRMVARLRETEISPPAALLKHQMVELERMVRHAHAHSAFYRERLSPVLEGGRFDFGRWRELPILTRAEAQTSFDGLCASEVPEGVGDTIEGTTSGSSGMPLRHRRSSFVNTLAACLHERTFEWYGIDRRARFASIRSHPEPSPFPDGSVVEGWSCTDPAGLHYRLDGATPLTDQVAWLKRVRPDYLLSYPTNLRALARALGGEARALGLSALFSGGEAVTPDIRAICEEHFAVPLIDAYGCTELGHLAAQCEVSGDYHVSVEAALLELVDASGAPVPAGTPGRVVVTSFYNFAMPFIRYDLGDYAVAKTGRCTCGRHLPRLERILGRTSAMFRYRDGTSVIPLVYTREIMPLVPHRQMQVVQTALDHVELRYVPAHPDQTNDLDGLTRVLRRRLHPSISVSAVAVEEIRRSRSGKFYECLSLIGDAEAPVT